MRGAASSPAPATARLLRPELLLPPRSRLRVPGAKLQLPTEEQPRTCLVDGLVQRSFPINGTQGEVELRGAGSFRAHEQIDVPDADDED